MTTPNVTEIPSRRVTAVSSAAYVKPAIGCGYCLTCGYGGEGSPDCLHCSAAAKTRLTARYSQAIATRSAALNDLTEYVARRVTGGTLTSTDAYHRALRAAYADAVDRCAELRAAYLQES